MGGGDDAFGDELERCVGASMPRSGEDREPYLENTTTM